MYIFCVCVSFIFWLSEVGDDNESTSESCIPSRFQQWSADYHNFSSCSSPTTPLLNHTTPKGHTTTFCPISSNHTIPTHHDRSTICTRPKHLCPHDSSCTCPSNTHANDLPASNLIPCACHTSPTDPTTDTCKRSSCLSRCLCCIAK